MTKKTPTKVTKKTHIENAKKKMIEIDEKIKNLDVNDVSKINNLIIKESYKIVEKVIQLANSGDPFSIKLLINKIIPDKKERAITLDIKQLENLEDIKNAEAIVLNNIFEGMLTPSEAKNVLESLNFYKSTIFDMQYKNKIDKVLELTKDVNYLKNNLEEF